ncbi:MAG: T9SS type A sorting domain-containing protein [Melioribacteraceae bacterium]|nr:T9SS type A sorting domain-containing protein [Melioribacteraceae bacterium]
MSNILLLTISFVLFFFSNNVAQQSSYYDWANNGFEFGVGDKLNVVVMATDSEGNLINAGSYTQFSDYPYVHKISPNGDFIWKLNDQTEGRILNLLVDENDNIFVAGYYYTAFPISSEDTLFVQKINSINNVAQVEWTYKIPIGDDNTNIVNRNLSLANLNSEIVVTGISVNSNSLAEVLTIKINEDGTELWSKTYSNNDMNDVSPKAMDLDYLGNIYICANSRIDESNSVQLIKYDSDGALLWEKNISSELGSKVFAVDLKQNNNALWVGIESDENLFLMKYDLESEMLWDFSLNNTKDKLGIIVDDTQNLFAVCADSIYKLSSAGDLTSSTELPLNNTVDYSYFAVDSDNSIYVVGQKDNFFLTKITSELIVDISFETVWDDPQNLHTESSNPKAVLHSEHGIFISGEAMIYDSTNFNSHPVQVTIKYSQLPTSVDLSESTPINFHLAQNYPNPFNPTTTIKFNIPTVETGHAPSQQTSLIVYDILGREIKTLINKQLEPGEYEVEFDGSDLSSGIDFYRLTANEFVQTRKMLLTGDRLVVL